LFLLGKNRTETHKTSQQAQTEKHLTKVYLL